MSGAPKIGFFVMKDELPEGPGVDVGHARDGALGVAVYQRREDAKPLLVGKDVRWIVIQPLSRISGHYLATGSRRPWTVTGVRPPR